MLLYVFGWFVYAFYMFSTEELRLATDRRPSAPVTRKKRVFVVSYKKNREGTVHCFLYMNYKKTVGPMSQYPVAHPQSARQIYMYVYIYRERERDNV